MAVKILVVDDEPDMILMFSQQFENHIGGFDAEFLFALNGKEALEIIEHNPSIDVVLTDINMPIMSGLELLAQINQKWPFIRVVVVSAYGDMNNIRKAMNQGSFDFIIKPINFNDLELTVASTIIAAKEARLQALESLNVHTKLIEIEKELDTARSIQEAIIPKNFSIFPEPPAYEMYGMMKPAKEVGGDFFDFFFLDTHLLALTIGDVSGKGVPAALFMQMSRAALRCFASKGATLSETIKQTNEFLCSRNDSGAFLTLFYGILDNTTGNLRYCNAGHNPPLLLSNDGSVEEIGRSQGIPLGISEGFEFMENEVALENFNSLLFYTDGITEGMNEKYEMFTETRLKQSFTDCKDKTAKQTVINIVANVQSFAGNAEQSDDITILCLKATDKKESA